MNRDAPTTISADRLRLLGLSVALLGLAGLALALFLARDALAQAYLVGWRYWLGISLGCLTLGLLQHLTGGAWSGAIRRALDAGASLVPLLGILMVPLVLDLGQLYPWADPALVAHDAALQHKQPYLNRDFFLVRAVGYFILWTASFWLAVALRRAVAQSLSFPAARRLRIASGLSLLLLGLSITFAAVDWTMSLEPHWYSSIYGVLIFVGHGLSGLSLAIVLTLALRAPHDRPTTGDAHDLGNLLLLATTLWAYMSFSQFLIIWYGNLPEEVVWYQRRLHGGWQWVALLLVLLHFAVPLVTLLPRDVKRNPRALGLVALWLLVLRWCDEWWLIAPAPTSLGSTVWLSRSIYLPWRELAATAAIGGLWLVLFAWRYAARPPVILPSELPRPEVEHE